MNENFFQFPDDPCGFLFALNLDTKIREKALPKIAEEEDNATAISASGRIVLPDGKWSLLINNSSDELYELMMRWPPGVVVSIESFVPPSDMQLAMKALQHLQVEHLSFAADSHNQLRWLADLPQLRSLDLSFITLTVDVADALAGTFQQLQWLDLSYATIEPAALAGIASIRSLRLLDLEQASMDGAQLSVISSLKNLEYLSLSGCALNADSIYFLSSLPALKYLKMSGCSLDNKSLAVLSSLKKLQVLDVSNNSLTDECLNDLAAGAKRLEHLNLSWNEFNGEQLDKVTDCSRLISLDVAGNPVSDGALLPALKNDSLANLSVSQTSITERLLCEGNIKNLRYLDLSDNRLDEKILNGLSVCRKLQTLIISNTDIALGLFLENVSFPDLRTLVVSRSQDVAGAGPDYASIEHGFSIRFPENWLIETHQIIAVSSRCQVGKKAQCRRYVPLTIATLSRIRRTAAALIRAVQLRYPVQKSGTKKTKKTAVPGKRVKLTAFSRNFVKSLKVLKKRQRPSWPLSAVCTMVSRVKYRCGLLSSEKANFIMAKREALNGKIQVVAAMKHEGVELQQYVQNSVNFYSAPNSVRWTIVETMCDLQVGALPAVRMVVDQHMKFTPDRPPVTVRVLKYFVSAEHRIFVVSASCAPGAFDANKHLFESTVSSFRLSESPAKSFRVIKL